MHVLCLFYDFHVSKNFQKPPSGLVITARRLMLTLVFSRFLPGTAWRWPMCRQATQGHNQVSGYFLMKCLAVMNTRQATRTCSLELDTLRVLEWCWWEGKEVPIICEGLGLNHHWIPRDWGLIGMRIVWAWS